MKAGLSPVLSALALLGLSGCVPATRANPTIGTSTAVSQVSFYPQQAGLSWNYLPDGDPAGAQPYVLRSLGPTLFGSTQVRALQLTGRGADQTSYRTYSEGGVYLHGFRKPGLSATLTPPWREFPAQGDWRVGLVWEGSSRVEVRSDDGRTRLSGTTNYRYTVLERRAVTVAGTGYSVWVVGRQISGDLTSLFGTSQESWFVPYVGDVKTFENLLLSGRNFQ